MRKIRPEVKETAEEKRISKNEFFEAITGVSVTKSGQKKENNKIPTVIPPDKLRKQVDELVEWKKKEKEAKAEKESREVDLIDWTKEKQDIDGLKGDFKKSYRIQGVEETVTFVSGDRFSSINSEDIPVLQEIFGDRFNEFMEKKITVSLNEEVMNDSNLQIELMSMIPKEKFKKFFKSETTFSPVSDFDRKIYSFGKKILSQIRDLVKQAKPSLR